MQSAILYQALKLHFNTDYDAIKYNFKIKSQFIPENQINVYKTLNSRYKKELPYFYVANFLENPKVWINELLSNECDEIFQKWKTKQESLSYIFKNELGILLDEYSLNELLNIKDNYPLLMVNVLQEKVSIETLLLINSVLQFIDDWDKRIKEEIIWIPFRRKCKKYYPFLKFDKDKIKEILKKEVILRT